ncbi:MAG TPA: HdeD family acid-resistance protein [Steroidobacteraceae bacterium]|nr:HdeD family acid-resistance protein [Steroidobacteraceae bacterium]
MATDQTDDARQPDDTQRFSAALGAALRHHWVLFLSEGIALVVLGLLAILVPATASIAATLLFGWILLISGVIGLATTYRARHAPGVAWSLVSAIIGIGAGVLLLVRPLLGLWSLTAILIAFFFLEGIASIFYALEHRKALSGRWGWMCVSGIIDVALAAILFAGLPGTAAWALGVLLGVNLLFGGWAMIVMALAARPRSPDAPA